MLNLNTDKAADSSVLKPLAPIPHFNFFQYPSLKPALDSERVSLLSGLHLGLGEFVGVLPFTVFVEIPYCRVRCNSCPFFRKFIPTHINGTDLLDSYLDCLIAEALTYAHSRRFSSAGCEAIYIGGGTASLLAPHQVDRLISALSRAFRIAPNSEITFEGNPRDFTAAYFGNIRRSGVTRVSLGYQSSSDHVLKMLNSPHRSQEGVSAVKSAIAIGFETVNVDLLYQVPGQTIRDWTQDITTVLDLNPASVTVSSYVIYPGTAAASLISTGSLQPPVDSGAAFQWYDWAREQFHQNGYIEYTSGNFSQFGHHPRYRALTFGHGTELVGLGAGAYSFINRRQFRNTGDPQEYMAHIQRSTFPTAEVSVQASHQNLMERTVIFNLFTFYRLSRGEFHQRFGRDVLEVFGQQCEDLEVSGEIAVTHNAIALTDQGIMNLDQLLYRFVSDEFKDKEHT